MTQLIRARQALVTFVILAFLGGAVLLPFMPSHSNDRSNGSEPLRSVPQFGIPRATPDDTGSDTYWVGAYSNGASALPNNGVSCSIQVAEVSTVSGALAFWCSDEASSGIWGQVGYYFANGNTPIAFWQVWNLNSYSEVATGTSSISLGTHTFAMYLQNGTTWAYSMDGTIFGTYDMGSGVSVGAGGYPVYALSEESYISEAFSFPVVSFSSAMNVDLAGVWTPVVTSNSYGTTWGVQGRMQNANLGNDNLLVGGNLPSLSSGTILWNGLPSGSSSSSTSSSTIATSLTITASSTTSSASVGYISIQPSEGPYSVGVAMTISGQALASATGSPVTGQSITLWVNGVNSGTITTNSNGLYLFNYTPLSTGSYVASVSSEANGGGVPSTQVTWIVSSATITSTTKSITSTTSATQTAITSNVTINSVDQNGDPITGYYTALSDSSGTVATGFTPTTFSTTSGQAYNVEADSYGSCTFSKWSNGITSDPLPFTATSGSLSFTAVFTCRTSTTSTLNVSTVNSADSPIAGYYITLWQGGIQIGSCFSSCSFIVNNGQTYQVAASSYGSETFSHWLNDGSTGFEVVAVPSTSTTISLTAVYSP